MDPEAEGVVLYIGPGRRVRKIPLDGQPVCPWLGGLEDVDSRGSVDRPGRSKLLRSLRKAL